MSRDESEQIALFERQTAAALARLEADPAALEDYRNEARAIAETGLDGQ